MHPRPRVLVVGAGIVGLCTAWYLARAGAEVTVVDRAGPGEGTSSGNAGAISAGSVAPLAMPGVLRDVPKMLFDPKGALHIPARYWPTAFPWLWRFVLAARPERVQEIAQALAVLLHGAEDRHLEILETEGAADLISHQGQLYLYRDRAHAAKDDAAWALRRAHGLEMRVLDRGEVLELEPEVSEAYGTGIFLPGQGHSVNPLRQAQVVARGVERLGGTIRRGTVTALRTENHRVTGAMIDGAPFEADHTVLAAGAWSAALLAPLGIKVPLESQRGYHVMLPNPGVMPRRPIIPADRKVFITPMEEGLRVAGSVEFGGTEMPPTPERSALLLEDLAKVYPQADTREQRPHWMGHRPCLPDSLPVLGPVKAWPGLCCAFGHGHLGLTGSAPTGALLAAALLGPASNTDLTPFGVERFA
ncbi:FAD-dependent oxidoreductase [Roseococcus sp. XZZS9]|uniref:FAD-dependent oxidoreductase n=1 Tax=Roseococcus pinisoli TaxID=2835040 RepID=A0ABS5QIY9_9PROT|nr:FAD-dependent oxidoreductase [Roseococcus pinisoli]